MKATRHVVTVPKSRAHPHRRVRVALASSGGDAPGGGEDEEDEDVPERYRERSDSNRWMKAGSMGSRYARSDVEVTWGMIGVAAVRAVCGQPPVQEVRRARRRRARPGGGEAREGGPVRAGLKTIRSDSFSDRHKTRRPEPCCTTPFFPLHIDVR
jgi:hypothetical protein